MTRVWIFSTPLIPSTILKMISVITKVLSSPVSSSVVAAVVAVLPVVVVAEGEDVVVVAEEEDVEVVVVAVVVVEVVEGVVAGLPISPLKSNDAMSERESE